MFTCCRKVVSQEWNDSTFWKCETCRCSLWTTTSLALINHGKSFWQKLPPESGIHPGNYLKLTICRKVGKWQCRLWAGNVTHRNWYCCSDKAFGEDEAKCKISPFHEWAEILHRSSCPCQPNLTMADSTQEQSLLKWRKASYMMNYWRRSCHGESNNLDECPWWKMNFPQQYFWARSSTVCSPIEYMKKNTNNHNR